VGRGCHPRPGTLQIQRRQLYVYPSAWVFAPATTEVGIEVVLGSQIALCSQAQVRGNAESRTARDPDVVQGYNSQGSYVPRELFATPPGERARRLQDVELIPSTSPLTPLRGLTRKIDSSCGK